MTIRERVGRITLVAVAAAMVIGTAPVMAVDIPGPVVQVTATVPANLTFDVTIAEQVNGQLPPSPTIVTAMDFGNLASNGTFGNPPKPRALNSTKSFQVFFGINAGGRPFTIKQSTSTPLMGDPSTGGATIPNGAFVVTPLTGNGGNTAEPITATAGAQTSAVGSNIVLFTSSGGSLCPTAYSSGCSMSATYGITDDPSKGSTAAIPLDQPAGTYTTTITYTATIT